MAVVCEADGFAFSVVAGTATSPRVLEEEVRRVPASLTTRGQKLAFLFREAGDNIGRLKPDALFLVRAGSGPRGGAHPERHEVEGVVQLAAEEYGVDSKLLLRDQVRVIWGAPKEKGSFEILMGRPDAAARSNATKRELYVFAVAALIFSGD